MDLNHTSKLLRTKRPEPFLDQVSHMAYVVHVEACSNIKPARNKLETASPAHSWILT